jgi:N-acetylglutamate synthase-like GNAT family acetyltransferase
MEFIKKTNNEDKDVLEIIRGWGSDIIVSRGKVYRSEDLEGILVYEDNKIIGLGLYYIKNSECEIVLLETFIEKKGIGTQIIEEIKEVAKTNNCKRIFVITTNNNIGALKFYQKRGFNFSNIYINAMEESRKIKPEIPKEYGGIEIRDEIEFEMKL